MSFLGKDKKQTNNNPSNNASTKDDNVNENSVEITVDTTMSDSDNTEEAVVERGMPSVDDNEIILPPEPELAPLVHGIASGVAYWGFSQRGESHILNGMPCQDRCVIDVVNSTPLIVAAIADGVGSCMLSHYGAAKATCSAVDYLRNELVKHRRKLDDAYIGDLLRDAMTCAYEAVHDEAQEMEQLEYSFQSTLTLAVYDGSTLYFSHAGDDGIVAILDDGTMDLATVRKKGEEASSVMPLQSLDWETRKSTNVNAFIMATDGVLDAFVRGEMEGNRIYYPFIEPAVKPGQLSDSKVKEVADFYYNYMESPEYRAQVTDDLTMVVITNQSKINEKNLPQFDQEAWDKYTAEREAQIKAALYPSNEPKKESKKKISYTSYSDEDWDEYKAPFTNNSYKSFCKYCGEEIILANSKFCPNCGKRLQLSYPNNSIYSNSSEGTSYTKDIIDGIKVPAINRKPVEQHSEQSTPKKKAKKNDSYRLQRKSNRDNYYDNYRMDEDRWGSEFWCTTFLLGLLVTIVVIFFFVH